MRVAVVANPASGGGRTASLIPELERRLSALGVSHEVRVSRSPEDPEHIARSEADRGTDVVAALGGDGLVGMVANGLFRTETAMAVLPAGSGNDFARMLGLRDLWSSVALLGAPRIAAVDAARISGDGRPDRAYVCVAGAGFDSIANEAANRIHRLRGKPKYALAVVQTLARFRPARFSVRVDGEDVLREEAMMVAIGNARSYGGGMNICPDASLTDGALDVCVVRALSRPAFLAAFPRVFRGSHVTHPAIRMFRGRTVDVSAEPSVPVYADGDPAGALPATFSVAPRALKVVIP